MSNTLSRTITRQLAPLDESQLKEIVSLMKGYGFGLNLFLDALKSQELREKLCDKYTIRNEIVAVLKNKGEARQEAIAKKRDEGLTVLAHLCEQIPRIPLQARMWKLALEEAVQMVKTYWASVVAETKHQCWKHDWYRNLNKKQRDYVDWLLKENTPQFFHLVGGRLPTVSEKNLEKMGCFNPKGTTANFKQLSRTEQKSLIEKVHKIVKKVRKNRIHYPTHHNNNRVDFDCSCWKQGHDEHGQYVQLMTHIPRKNMRLYLKGWGALRGTLQLFYQKRTRQYVLHVYHELKCNDPIEAGRAIGIDLGYTELCATSDGDLIGQGLGEMIAKHSEGLNARTQGRNKLRAIKEQHEKSGTQKGKDKAKNIEENNLGKGRLNRAEAKAKAEESSFINHSINELINTKTELSEKQVGTVVMERLTTFTKNKRYPKKINRYLSAWSYGYIHDRILFKCKKAGIKVVEVNPAWSSVTCPMCGHVNRDNRHGDKFQCQNCGATEHADVNSAVVILRRKEWKACTLYMTPRQIKYYLENNPEWLLDK